MPLRPRVRNASFCANAAPSERTLTPRRHAPCVAQHCRQRRGSARGVGLHSTPRENSPHNVLRYKSL
eukprot:6208201-Pleurochrysis_carterae.AAC.1